MENKRIMTNDEYKRYVSDRTPKSNTLLDCLKAFAVGGTICLLGQGLHDLWALLGVGDNETVGTLTSITLVFLGAALTGLGVYDRIGKFAGAGSIVPSTGFANSIVSPAMEFKREGLILGTAAKMFTIAGPVLVYGVGASVIVGLITCLVAK